MGRDEEIIRRFKAGESAISITKSMGLSSKTLVYNALRAAGIGRRTVNSLAAEQETKILARYAAGEAVNSIAKDFAVHKQTIHNMLERRGVGTNPTLARKEISDDVKTQIVDACRDGMKIPDVMARFGVSEKTVNRYLQLARERGEEIVLPQGTPRTRTVDDTAFDVLTPESLYWRGFLHADGCVHQDAYGSPVLVCGLGEKDIGHLIKLRSFLKSTHAIAVHQGKQSLGGPTAYYRVRSKQICASLTAYGLVTHRTLTPAAELSSSLDFWRGAVDGDGWIGVSENKGHHYAYIGFCGQIPVVKAFQQFLSKRDLADLNITPTESGIWKVQTMGSKAQAIIKLLYKNAAVSLDRKMARASEIVYGNLAKFPPYEEGPSRKRLEAVELDALIAADF